MTGSEKAKSSKKKSKRGEHLKNSTTIEKLSQAIEPKKRGAKSLVGSRMVLYNKIFGYADEIIETLVKLMRGARQESVKQAAAKELLARLVPSLRHTQHSGAVGIFRVLSDKEYETALRARGIDPRTGRKIGATPTTKNKGS